MCFYKIHLRFFLARLWSLEYIPTPPGPPMHGNILNIQSWHIPYWAVGWFGCMIAMVFHTHPPSSGMHGGFFLELWGGPVSPWGGPFFHPHPSWRPTSTVLSSYGLLYTLFGLLGFTDTVDKALMCAKGDFKHNINMQSWEWIICTTLLCIWQH